MTQTGQAKQCPRCGRTFLCMHGAHALCECAAVTLSPDTRTYLREHYNDCLCVECLKLFEVV